MFPFSPAVRPATLHQRLRPATAPASVSSRARARSGSPLKLVGNALGLFALTLGLGLSAQAQTFTPLSSTLTPTDLAQRIVGTGVSVSNVTFQGVNGLTAGKGASAGTFSGGNGILGADFDQGIVLSSGKVVDLVGPNNSTSTSTGNGSGSDADLAKLITTTVNDATTLSFNFVPDKEFVTFRYVFGSEEYNEFVGGSFNDVFGFFVNGTNVALIPGTTTVVSINNVNLNKNSSFYRNNVAPTGGTPPLNTELDGLTVVLTVQAQVNVGKTNTLKLAVADAGDSAYDSAVFIQADTFTSVPSGLSIDDVSVTEGNSGTTNADFTVTLAPSNTQTVTVNYATQNGTATQPGDYTATYGSLTFTPGQTTKTISVPVKGDTLAEGDETFTVKLSNPTNATLGDAQGIGTITNDDTAPTNSAPVAKAQSITVTTGQSKDGQLTATDADGDALTFAKASNPTNGTVTVNPDGSFTYTPSAGFIGSDSFTFTANDGTATSAPATVSISVIAVSSGGLQAATNLIAVAKDQFIVLSWTDNSTGESGYKVERRIGTTGKWKQLIRATTPDQNGYVDETTQEGVTYFYRVRPYIAFVVNGPYSNIASETATGIATPTNLTAAYSAAQNGVVLNWTDNATTESGYKVERKANGSIHWFGIFRGTTPDQTSYVDQSAQKGKTYSYRVRPYIAFKVNGFASNVASATVPVSPPSGLVF